MRIKLKGGYRTKTSRATKTTKAASTTDVQYQHNGRLKHPQNKTTQNNQVSARRQHLEAETTDKPPGTTQEEAGRTAHSKKAKTGTSSNSRTED